MASCRVLPTAEWQEREKKCRILSGMRHPERDRESSVADNSRTMRKRLAVNSSSKDLSRRHYIRKRSGASVAACTNPLHNPFVSTFSLFSMVPFILSHLTNSEQAAGSRNRRAVECRRKLLDEDKTLALSADLLFRNPPYRNA